MDMRNGDIYPDRATALAAGVPADQIAEVEPEIVRVASGPFRGRVYERNPFTRQLVRRRDLEGPGSSTSAERRRRAARSRRKGEL